MQDASTNVVRAAACVSAIAHQRSYSQSHTGEMRASLVHETGADVAWGDEIMLYWLAVAFKSQITVWSIAFVLGASTTHSPAIGPLGLILPQDLAALLRQSSHWAPPQAPAAS